MRLQSLQTEININYPIADGCKQFRGAKKTFSYLVQNIKTQIKKA